MKNNNKSFEALDDEALDAVTGGEKANIPNRFKENNCMVCCHFNVDCPYGGSFFGYIKWGDTLCPGKA